MQSLDLLGAQLGDTHLNRKESKTSLHSSDDSSFKRHFDREVSGRRNDQKNERPLDAQSTKKERAAPKSEHVAAEDSQASNKNVNREAPEDGDVNAAPNASIAKRTEPSSSVDPSAVATEPTEGETLDSDIVAPILRLHIEQDGLPSERYFEQSHLLKSDGLELETPNVELVPSSIPQVSAPIAGLEPSPIQELSANQALGELQRRMHKVADMTSAQPELSKALTSDPNQVSNRAQVDAAPATAAVALKPTNVVSNLQASASNLNLTPLTSSAEVVTGLAEAAADVPASALQSAVADKAASLTPQTLSPQAARYSVDIQFGRADWNNGVAAKVAQMAAQNLNYAEIRLDPPELGPLHVRVHLHHDQASVSFTAQSAQVREALEQGNQRLRELLESEGLNLVDVDVSDQQQQQGQDELDSEQAGETKLASDVETDEADVNVEQVVSTALQMGVDDFV